MKRILPPGVLISAYLSLCLLAAVVPALSRANVDLEELIFQDSECTLSARRESVCRSTNQSAYQQYIDNSTQESLEEFLANADLLLAGLAAGEAEGCRSIITNLLCNIVFPPCFNDSAQDPLSVCPSYCTCLNASCASVYRKLQDMEESDMLASMILNLTERCAPVATSNSSAAQLMDSYSDEQCVSCPEPTNPPGEGEDGFLSSLSMNTVLIGAGVASLLLIVLVVAVLEGLCCYYCCAPAKMKMPMTEDYEADLARGFRITVAKEFDYSMPRERTMSRAAMLKMVLFNRITQVRRTRFQPQSVTHSKLPEPYKTILKDQKHLVIQHNKISLDKMISKGVVGELYHGAMLEPSGGQSIVPVPMAVRVVDDVAHEGICIQMVQDICKVADLLHPHLLRPVGVAIEVEKPLYIIYPFMENRDIKTYLRTLQGTTGRMTVPRINLVFQVALGMEFLASRGLVHRNLCAKHCVLDRSLTVKISGFGAPENYAMATTYSLPAEEVDNWKWLPLELLHHVDSLEAEHFRECTDVWSFGVTAWEIFTLEEPYEGKYLSDIIPKLEKGKRLSKPQNCADAIYQLLLWCWLPDTTRRPTMQEVASTVHKYLGEGWEAEFGASSSGPSSGGESGASLASAGEFPNGEFCEMSKWEDPTVSPPALKTVEIVRSKADKGWGKEAKDRRRGEIGKKGGTYINVLSKRSESEDEYDLARSSAWTDGEPDEEYIISLEDFIGIHRESDVTHQMEVNKQREDGNGPNNPIYSNTSLISLNSLHSESTHSNAAKAAHPSSKNHALQPSRSAEEGNLSPKPHRAPPKRPNMYKLH